MFKAIPYDEKIHYKIAVQWWKEHKWPNPPDKWELPPTGVVVMFNAEPISMTWIHRGDGNACWMAWFISNRFAQRDIRNRSIDLLIDTCIEFVRGLGYKQLFTLSKHKRLLKRFAKKEFRLTENDMTIVLKEL